METLTHPHPTEKKTARIWLHLDRHIFASVLFEIAMIAVMFGGLVLVVDGAPDWVASDWVALAVILPAYIGPFIFYFVYLWVSPKSAEEAQAARINELQSDYELLRILKLLAPLVFWVAVLYVAVKLVKWFWYL
jgi:Ca2+/Na+ antiporter